MAKLPGDGIGDAVLNGHYRILEQVKGSVGSARSNLGVKGSCRYCGNTDPKNFRKLAHTFPEALGNKWIFSLDECDRCNALFGVYDDALANAVSPFLTLSGVKGKGNKIRTTGRTGGTSQIQRIPTSDLDRISIALNGLDPGNLVSVDPATGVFRFETPLPATPFKPRHTYKALCKSAFALLPAAERPHYETLRRWLLDPAEEAGFPILDVGFSFSIVGRQYPLLAGTLLQRVQPEVPIPYIVFIAAIGPVCFQIGLLSDHMDDHIAPGDNPINIRWSSIVGDETGTKFVKLDYGQPTHLNWSSATTQPQPVEKMILEFNPVTCAGSWTPVLR